jgi:transposase
MQVIVHSAAIQHRDAAGLALDKFRRRFPWLELIWADVGYNAWQVNAAVAKVPRLRLAVVKQSDDMKDFVVLPRRWVVERTFSWFARNGGVAKDCENRAEALATFITPASVQPGPRRFARESLNKRRSWRAGPVTGDEHGCYGFGEETFARTRGKGQDAPLAAIPMVAT